MTTDDWSRSVRCEHTGGDVRYEFPARQLGWGRLLGLFLVGFGLLFAWHPAHDIWQTILKCLHSARGGAEIYAEIFFGLFELLFVMAGCVPLAIGLWILFGRCRLEWKDGQFRATEILGPLRWTRRLPRQPIRKLEVAAATSTSGNSAPRQLDGFSGLAAEFEDGSRKLVVLGYPKDWLLGVADDLKNLVGSGAFSGIAPQIEVVQKALNDETDIDVPEQPAGSRVRVEEGAGVVQLTVPAAGLRRGSFGLFPFAVLWCVFMTVFTTLMFLPGSKTEGSLRAVIPFLVGFWTVGLGLLVAAINLGRRTVTLTVEGDQLRLETKGLLGGKLREWNRGEIAAIRADSSNVAVNHRRLLELQIIPVTGRKVGLLAGRDDSELRWLATRLRQALKVPAQTREPEANSPSLE
ncbi:MAG TPA: hypothetical protein VMB80_02850 [Candidatus Acidoferrum sp.]|nr:hypothetical protein [Candidatus Acidoferrum sp.]